MKTVTMKIDEKLARELQEIAADGSRSEVIREAVRQYVAACRIKKRRAEVKAYLRSSTEQDQMRELGESDMDDAEDLLAREEKQR